MNQSFLKSKRIMKRFSGSYESKKEISFQLTSTEKKKDLNFQNLNEDSVK